MYRKLCKHHQRNDEVNAIKDERWPWTSSSELPPQKDRIKLLHDFDRAHARNIQKSVHCDMLLRGGPDVFDFKNHFLEINLRYRTDCGGNPSIAFRVESASTCPLSKIKPESGFGKALDSGRASRERDEAYLKTQSSSFVGVHLVMLAMEDYGLWTTHPIHRTPTFDEGLRRANPHLWFRELQFSVENGFVFERLEPEDDAHRLGRIKLVGRKWKFVELAPQELDAIGLGANYPGFLF